MEPRSVSKLLENTLEAAYWVGFIFADGSTSGRRLTVTLAGKDGEHVKALAQFLGPGFKVSTSSLGNVSVSHQGDSVTELRNRFGLVDRKTYNPPEHLPYKDPDLLRAFAIGLIDGDGQINRLTNRRYSQMNLVSHLCWLPFLTKLQEALNLGHITVRGNGSGRTYATWRIGKQRDVVDLARWGMDKELPVLQRKWAKVDLDFKPKELFNLELDAQVISMYTQGESVKQITEITGLTPGAVHQRTYRYRRSIQNGSLVV